MYKGRDYRYRTNCTMSTYEAITAMVDQAREITWSTLLRHVPIEEIRSIFNWYEYHGQGLHIKNDWHVTFHKSTYLGVPCYYIQQSGIEYIWSKQ